MNEPIDPQATSESERDVVELIRSIDVRAPDSLHANVDAMIAGRTARAKRSASGSRTNRRERSADRRERASATPRALGGASRRFAPRLAALGSIAAAIIALVIVVSLSGGSSTLSVHDASALTLRAATTAAPRDSSTSRGELAASVEGVSFPYWGAHFGWRSTGQRSDRVDGRQIATVFYENAHGQRVGYAIVAGSKPPQVTGGVVSRRDGTPYRLLTVNGVAVVAWTREGHLCVISGRHVEGATLLRLASWDDHHTVTD
jgi:anti-sigma factor RsiW